MRNMKAAVLILILAGTSGFPCQAPAPPAEKLTFDKLMKATRVTLRDSAELPMEMKVSFVASDSSGRVRKQKTNSYQYDFNGFNPRSGHYSWHMKGEQSTMGAAASSA